MRLSKIAHPKDWLGCDYIKMKVIPWVLKSKSLIRVKFLCKSEGKVSKPWRRANENKQKEWALISLTLLKFFTYFLKSAPGMISPC